MSEAHASDSLQNLVKFLICLAIAGTIIALIIYFIVIVPGQHAALFVPQNAFPTAVNGQITDAIT